jgi:hypothetical protein
MSGSLKCVASAVLVVFCVLVTGASAQGDGGNAVTAVLALVEAVDPDRVEALRADALDESALALALLTSLEADRLLDADVAAVMRAFVTADGDSVSPAEGPIEFNTSVMNLLLLDLVSGTEPLTSVLDRNIDADVTGSFSYVSTGPETLDVTMLLANAESFEGALANITVQATGFAYRPRDRFAPDDDAFDPLPVGASPSLLRDAFETRSAVLFEPGDTVPGVVALLEFARLIDPSLIADLDLPDGATPFDTALALLDSLREQNLLDPNIAASVEALIESGDEAPPGLLDYLWVDMVTGDADLEDVFAAAVDAAVASGRVRPEDAEALSMKMSLSFEDLPEHEVGRYLLDLQDVLDAFEDGGLPVLTLSDGDLDAVWQAVAQGTSLLEESDGPLAVVPSDVVTDVDNPAVAAIIAYLNLLDRDLVAELEALGLDGGPLAVALLLRPLAAGVIEPAVFEAMLAVAVDPDGVVDRDLLALFVLDVVTGTEPLGAVLTRLGLSLAADGSFDLAAVLLEFEILGDAVDAAIQAEAPGLRIPATDPDGNVTAGSVTATVLEILDDADAVAAIQDRYRAAISPVAEGSLSDPR